MSQQQLRDPVRTRVVVLASDALGRLPVEQVPTALKRVATFAPTRRARLAGAQILDVLSRDEHFRENLATQVGGSIPEALRQALQDGVLPDGADPVEAAAAA